jgi:hypothetical protein
MEDMVKDFYINTSRMLCQVSPTAPVAVSLLPLLSVFFIVDLFIDN